MAGDDGHRTFNVAAHPGSSSAALSQRMSRLARRDTGPEVAVRKILHAAGLRYRVAYRIPGRARRSVDIAFTRARVAVFIDGCFWHGCPQHGVQPTANSEWWKAKITTNKARDADTTQFLQESGWAVFRFWEHESPEDVADTICRAVRAPA